MGINGEIKRLFSHRDLITILVFRDLKSRYRRSFLGLIWTLLNPILSSLILWLVFVSIFKSSLSNGTQFAPYLLAGVLIITFFSQGFIQSAEAISNSAGLFLKIRVAPQIFAFASSLSNAINFFLGTIALTFVSFISGSSIKISSPLILFVGVCLVMYTTGLGLIFGNLFIRFDDVKYIVTILLQLLVYLTPVFYPKEMLGTGVGLLVSLNPLTSYLDVFRNVFNGTEIATTYDWIYMCVSSIVAFVAGFYVFKKNWHNSVAML
jgi:ABC-type polysaccharide/polyol phosphate export permease